MMLRLRTFGAVHLERDSTPLGGAHSQRRRLALLAYLAATGNTAVTREKLIALLWPESHEAGGRHSLSQLLYSVRHDLGPDVIAVDTETVRLNAAALPSDVQAFDEALRASRFEDAVAEYRGAFLDGFHVEDAPDLDRWIDAERARRAHDCARALDRLADAAEKSRDWHRAVDWLRRRVLIDPTDSRTTMRLMQALSAIGDRDGAVRSARIYESLVRSELEAEPDSAIVELAEHLRRVAQPVTPPPQPTESIADTRHSDLAPTVLEAISRPGPAGEALQQKRPLRRWIIAAVVTFAIVSVAAILLSHARRNAIGGGAGAPRATVIIGDLEGPDSVLALAVREALRAELVNTPGVVLTSDLGIRELKTLMRLPRDSALQRSQLLTLATRGGAQVVVAGSVVPVGTGAQIVLELVDPSSGRPLRTFTERPVDGAATLDAVERIARSIGAAVSKTPLDARVQPLPAVTTASLAALKNYALARQTAASGFRKEAVAPAERAVAHDSTFVLAHYFLGDLLWFLDEQTHSEAHLTRAYELLSTVPPREQLVIRARYEQLARDRPDSALAYWQLLADASPGDLLAYEGRTWALRALGRHEEAAAAADTAMSLEPGALLPNITNAVYSWLSVGDTANALAIAKRVQSRYPGALTEARFYAALYRDPASAIPWADSAALNQGRHWRRHMAQVAAGDVAGARVTLDSILADDVAQMPPNALLNQGWVELTTGGDPRAVAKYARATLEWMRRRDLSPPAIGRLSERIADLAARAGDAATVVATTALVRDRDRGRSLRTYEMTLRTLGAAQAYVAGDYAEAARRAESARQGVYFSRSLTTIVLLEADARRAAGQTAAADSLERLIATHQIVDGHFEVWAILKALKSRD